MLKYYYSILCMKLAVVTRNQRARAILKIFRYQRHRTLPDPTVATKYYIIIIMSKAKSKSNISDQKNKIKIKLTLVLPTPILG